jgi:hypothetical protein
MVDATRFQFLLPEQHRRELVELAARTGFSRADLVRLAIGRLLEDPAGRVLPKPPAHSETGAAA